jgi:hypothetical protein
MKDEKRGNGSKEEDEMWKGARTGKMDKPVLRVDGTFCSM